MRPNLSDLIFRHKAKPQESALSARAISPNDGQVPDRADASQQTPRTSSSNPNATAQTSSQKQPEKMSSVLTPTRGLVVSKVAFNDLWQLPMFALYILPLTYLVLNERYDTSRISLELEEDQNNYKVVARYTENDKDDIYLIEGPSCSDAQTALKKGSEELKRDYPGVFG
ncbi:uncharacterized protein J4E79_002422 [Alternaria viburni]|uniref:uncharacterized protein n=1 Tax=Alternaria viburni TaxID=566460 RepID=UPI0020C1FD28|nr:uncharacterized protein J4E79_002422 [Alternaria viburni]KAI4666384.1 hypothetical protein J4E79_002422 [Alternaria viburni]